MRGEGGGERRGRRKEGREEEDRPAVSLSKEREREIEGVCLARLSGLLLRRSVGGESERRGGERMGGAEEEGRVRC